MKGLNRLGLGETVLKQQTSKHANMHSLPGSRYLREREKERHLTVHTLPWGHKRKA